MNNNPEPNITNSSPQPFYLPSSQEGSEHLSYASEVLFSPISSFEEEEVYFYYDGPKLFTATHQPSNKLFLFSMVSEDEETGAPHFLYSELSKTEIADVKDQKIDLRDAFLKAESGIAFVSEFGEPDVNNVRILLSSEIPDDFLVKPGIFL